MVVEKLNIINKNSGTKEGGKQHKKKEQGIS